MTITGLLMWGVDRTLAVGSFNFPMRSQAAIAIVIAGLALMMASIASFAIARTTVNPLKPSASTKLVTAGLFSISRNPIYFGDALVLTGLAVWLGNIFNLALLALFILYINRFQIIPKERALIEIFGEEYLAYRSRVGRWL